MKLSPSMSGDYFLFIQHSYKLRMRDAQTQTNHSQASTNYQPIQTVSQQVRPSAFSNRAVSKSSPPIKRCQFYKQFCISRTEGSKLCAAVGFGRRVPLTAEQVEYLSVIIKDFKTWKEAGHSVSYFISQYFN